LLYSNVTVVIILVFLVYPAKIQKYFLKLVV